MRRMNAIKNVKDNEGSADGYGHGSTGDAENVLEFDLEFGSRPILFKHFSMGEETAATAESSEHSPLLNPLKPRRGGKARKRWMYNAWQWYEGCLDRRPLLTKAITSAFLTLLADVVGQCLEQGHNIKFDLGRLVRFATMGMFLQAPVTHYWYVLLDYCLPPTPYPWTPTTFVKLAFDQLLYAPSFMVLVITYLAIFSGSSWHGVLEQLKDEFAQTIVDNWKLWAPATIINLAYVPPALRVLYCNVIFFVWSIYLSLALGHQKEVDELLP